ncbi:MAG: SDR family oxidoreductase [Bacteroidetes bacterium]|nr:SDR family oxidoreductase [Bacteroidota bacterium]
MLEINLQGKTALITGATQGIGKSIADHFLEAGADLILTGTKQHEIDALNKKNVRLLKQNVKYIQLDLSSVDSTQTFIKTLEELPRIDICINNAGVNKVAEFIHTSEEDFDWINQINLYGPYRILQSIIPGMIENKFGRIVNIASIWSVVTRKGRSLYTSSKNALVGLTETIAVELAQHNILVNAVSPGFTLTELTKNTNTPEELSLIESTIPLRRLALPGEIATLVAFLSSELNSYTTGQNIVIDGGYTNL